MNDHPTRLLTKVWLAACLSVLAVALVPVLLPNTSVHGRYTIPHSNRLQRHSFLNVTEGRPDAKLPKLSHAPLPFGLLNLIGPQLDPWHLLGPGTLVRPLLSVLPHRRKLGRASPGDPDLLV